MSDGQRDLQAYYEAEARLGSRRPPSGRRVGIRNEFVELLQREQRSSVLDFGAGPGGDAVASLAAGWSMSALMHVPEADVVDVVAAMAASLEPGAPLLAGLWGSERSEVRHDVDIEGHQRLFDLRTFERNRELIETIGPVERALRWPTKQTESHYQIFLVRCRPAP